MPKNHPISRGFSILFSLCMLFAVQAWGQTYTQGSIAGTVFDASGAVIANAEITIHNVGTNADMHLTSEDGGFFKAPELPAAIYTVTVSAPGFAPFREVNVIVQVGQTTQILPRLQAGGTTATVEVTGEAPVLNF